MSADSFRVIGLMSGTSLDGLDVVCVDFIDNKENIDWEIIASHCFKYSDKWTDSLSKAHLLSGEKLSKLHSDYGVFLGEKVNEFIKIYKIKNIDLISSHGHTVFHQPENGFTLQIGSGVHIKSTTKHTVVCDFRSEDVALGGQGAPLVPIGDKLLFDDYEACLNIGGFANISFDYNNKRIAFDICPANFVLNHLCKKINKEFDENGLIARGSQTNLNLLKKLNELDYYKTSPPKSLGREWVLKNIFPILEDFNISTEDKIATFTVHIAQQISKTAENFKINKILCTGGGTYNQFLIETLKSINPTEIHIPKQEIIDYKEAIVFALLGYLRINERVNILSSVTGAKKDISSGNIC